jgi:hypothetical protein
LRKRDLNKSSGDLETSQKLKFRSKRNRKLSRSLIPKINIFNHLSKDSENKELLDE